MILYIGQIDSDMRHSLVQGLEHDRSGLAVVIKDAKGEIIELSPLEAEDILIRYPTVQKRYSTGDHHEVNLSVMLKKAIADEEDAIQLYREYAQRIRKVGENMTADLFSSIARQEEEHMAKFQKRMRDLDLY